MTDGPETWWNQAYEGEDDVPWDIGRPQPAIARLAERGEIRGTVLDVGCGTGTHALYLAARDHRVGGIDISERAIERARERARADERDLEVTFRVGNVFDLTADLDPAVLFDDPDETVETVVDSGTFHVFEKHLRESYAERLWGTLESGGRAFVLAFSEEAPPDWGPTPVDREEFEEVFANGWRVRDVRDEPFETTHRSVAGYLAVLERM